MRKTIITVATSWILALGLFAIGFQAHAQTMSIMPYAENAVAVLCPHDDIGVALPYLDREDAEALKEYAQGHDVEALIEHYKANEQKLERAGIRLHYDTIRRFHERCFVAI